METVEKILNGDQEEFKEEPHLYREEDHYNPDCWIHHADTYKEDEKPQCLVSHDNRRLEAEIQNLEIELKYREEPNENYTE